MAVSRNTRNRSTISFWYRYAGQLSRYDLVLAAIPILFALALFSYLLLPVSFHAAGGASAVMSVVLMADAMYVNPPQSPGSA